jgi:polyisoprenyl-phosphate glycosyltransferase
MSGKKFSVVIPCYNEAKNIPLILEKFAAVIDRPDFEVVLVNNGSTDESAGVLERLLPRYPFARTVNVDVNRGYGFGILTGLRAAAGEWIGWTHADLQTDPADVVKAAKMIERAADPQRVFVKGNRRGRSLFDNFFTVGMAIFESLFLGQWLWDINAQPTLFPRSFFAAWTNPPHDFSLDLYAYYQARRQNLRVLRFPVRFPPRIHGTSSWNTGWAAKGKFIKRTLDFSFKLTRILH